MSAFVKLLITFSQCTLCALCLFSALSCRVGALQISMILICEKNLEMCIGLCAPEFDSAELTLVRLPGFYNPIIK